MPDRRILDSVRHIRECAVRTAELSEQHQTPAMRAALADIPTDTWHQFLLAVRIPDDAALMRALNFGARGSVDV